REIIQADAPSFLISLHQNLYPSASSRGGVVFYKKGDEKSKRLALLMQERINDLYLNAGGRARTCAEGEFYILECGECPSVLIECGFLSSPLDEKLLIDGVFQQKFVSVITSALTDYLVSA
ncbi:MAG: N-acetylmuramoyl-L-alanine amidase, partial [Clostridia bacterium]|nr:N-acetylmuramoyl-L-alanine amidase [Clostridia bacterium]